MFENLKKLREEKEDGFTLIELLVVILIIGILSAIAIPVFLNQRKAAVDGSVQSDVRNAVTVVETWNLENGAKGDVPVTTATLYSNEFKNTDSVDIAVNGTNSGYCITGTSSAGDVAADTGYVYASLTGLTSTSGKACLNGNLVDTDIVIPDNSGEVDTSAPDFTNGVAHTFYLGHTMGSTSGTGNFIQNNGDIILNMDSSGRYNLSGTFIAQPSNEPANGTYSFNFVYYTSTGPQTPATQNITFVNGVPTGNYKLGEEFLSSNYFTPDTGTEGFTDNNGEKFGD